MEENMILIDEASIKDAGKKAFEISTNEDPKILECILSRLDMSD